MVHRKSEYTLQYKLLSNDLRKQIWQNNISRRSDLRAINQGHHFWSFQLSDEKCQCDEDDPLSNDDMLRFNRDQKYFDSFKETSTQTQWSEIENNYVRESSLINDKTKIDNRSFSTKPLSQSSFIQPIPTRTSRNIYAQGKRSYFAPFANNVTDTDIGKNKTFNVHAPQNQVHEAALAASKTKNYGIKAFLSRDYGKEDQFKSHVPIGNSSLWMSEYQDNFGLGLSLTGRRRPVSVPSNRLRGNYT